MPTGADLLAILRRWKAIDVTITEYTNEAMDNEKYLRTLEKFINPLCNHSSVSNNDSTEGKANEGKHMREREIPPPPLSPPVTCTSLC